MNTNHITLCELAKTRRCSHANELFPKDWMVINNELVRKHEKTIKAWTSNNWVNYDMRQGYCRSERNCYRTNKVLPDSHELAYKLLDLFAEVVPLPVDVVLFRGIKGPEPYKLSNIGFTSHSVSMFPTFFFSEDFGTLLITIIPRGTKMVYIPKENSAPTNSDGTPWVVGEVLLSPYTEYVVGATNTWKEYFGRSEFNYYTPGGNDFNDYVISVKETFGCVANDLAKMSSVSEPSHVIVTALTNVKSLHDVKNIWTRVPTYNNEELTNRGYGVSDGC